jgi:hypothetical protein
MDLTCNGREWIRGRGGEGGGRGAMAAGGDWPPWELGDLLVHAVCTGVSVSRDSLGADMRQRRR